MDQYAQLGGKDDANSTRQWAVYLKGDTNEFAVLAVDSASGLYFNAGAGSWTDSTTYHLIVTYGSTDKIMRLYKNTVLQITSDPLTNGINTIASWPFEIGARSIVSAARFSGMLDLIGYWQRVLTTAEIIRFYNSGYGLSYAQMIVTPSSLGSSLFSAGRPHGLGGGSDERRWF
jgi:hypothetical protein